MTDEEMQEMMRKGKVLREIGQYKEALFYYRHAASMETSARHCEGGSTDKEAGEDAAISMQPI